MANVIQVKRGANASLPTLNPGEFGFSTDTHQLYIGDGATNHEIVLSAASTKRWLRWMEGGGVGGGGSAGAGTGAGTGEITAAANLTDNAIVRGDGGAKGIQTSTPTIDDSGNVVLEWTKALQSKFSDTTVKDVVKIGYGGNNGLVIGSTGYGDPVYFVLSGGVKARILANGKMGIGVDPSNANGGILQLKEGITFPATAIPASDVNTLDDYKEGEVTVGLSCTTSGTITLDGSYEKLGYTKIGRQVTVVGSVYVSSVSSPTGGLTLTGLPYTVGNSDTKAGAVSVYATGLETSAYDGVVGKTLKNTTTLRLSTYYNGTTYSMAGDIKAGSDIYICGTYFV